MATLKINESKLRRIMEDHAQRYALAGAEAAQERVRANITTKPRVDTGKMRESVGVRQIDANTYRVHSGTFYTMYQENGVGVIRPKKAQALRFKPKGSNTFVFAKKTRGFPPGHFFKDTVNQMVLSDFIG